MTARLDDGPQPTPGAVRRGWFVLRLWREPGDGWRGQISHVQTGEGVFFRTESRLWDFVRACLHLEPGDALLEPETVELGTAHGQPCEGQGSG